jgi:hypothetical protein
MAMTTVDVTRSVTGGVDTHLDVNVAAALDAIGGLLGVAEFPTTPVGHRRLAEFLASFGTLTRVGVEGIGSYGAGLSRYLRGSAVEVVEVEHRSGMSAEMLAEVKHSWCRPSDNAIHQDFYWQPQRDSNPCLHLERVVS